LNKSKSPKRKTENKTMVKEFNLKQKDLTENMSREMKKERSLSK
jgi:hypothetical protein